MRKTATVFASISACIAVILGALGTHGLSKMDVKPESLHAYETAVQYQLLHSITMLAIIALNTRVAAYFKTIMNLMMVGILMFSGSIYLLVMGDILKIDLTAVGPVTPIGGLSLIAAWFILFLSALKYQEQDNNN